MALDIAPNESHMFYSLLVDIWPEIRSLIDPISSRAPNWDSEMTAK